MHSIQKQIIIPQKTSKDNDDLDDFILFNMFFNDKK